MERLVVSGDHSFTIVPKEGETSSYNRDSLKHVSECSEGGSELYCVKAENERLHKVIKDLETQLASLQVYTGTNMDSKLICSMFVLSATSSALINDFFMDLIICI